MRRALVTTALASGLVLGGAAMSAPVHAAPPLAANVDSDEPAAQDGNDDTGKYGLIGLTGLLGLFGYKKYRDSHPRTGTRADGSGSRRV